MNYKYLLLLLMLPVIYASEPAYNVVDNILTNVELGNNDIGTLVFVSAQYVAEYHNVNNFEDISVQRYDIINWENDTSITAFAPSGKTTILTSGSEYYLSEIGEYTLTSLANTSLNFVITSTQEDFNVIDITKIIEPDGFNITFSIDNFVLQSEQVVNIIAVIDDDVIKGNYNFSYLVNNKTKSHIFSVAEKHDWNITDNTINSTINAKVGDNIHLGYYTLQNTGNVEAEIVVEKSGNSTFLVSTPQPFTLYKKTNSRIDLQLQIPTTQKPGVYNIIINITSSKKNVEYPIKISIIDGILPSIEMINFSTDKAFKENKIVVIATDNNEVLNVTLRYDNKLVIFEKDEQLYSAVVTFEKLSRYILDFCATDYDGNVKCTLINKTFVKSKAIIDFDNSITMPSKKVGLYSTMMLFNLTEDIIEGINVELVEFVPLGNSISNGSYTIRIIDGDESIKTITQFDKDAIIYKKGIIKIEIRSEEVVNYNGLLRFTSPAYIEEVSDLNFKVSFKSYDVPEDFTKQWLNDRELNCKVIDTGNLDTSYYRCSLDFPIDTRPEEISVPTTVSERDSFTGEAGKVQEELDSKKSQFGIFISLFSVFIVLLILTIWYVVFQHPYIRFSTGHKLKNKQGGTNL